MLLLVNHLELKEANNKIKTKKINSLKKTAHKKKEVLKDHQKHNN